MLSDYAKKRVANLKSNKEKLLEIGLAQSVAAVVVKAEPTTTSKPRAPSKRSHREISGPALPTRSSSRVKHNTSTVEAKEAYEATVKADKDKADEDRRRRKHDPRRVEALTSVTGSGDNEALHAEFEAISLRAKSYETDWFKSQPPPIFPDAKSTKVLREKLETDVEHRGTVKVTDARVYSLCFHPDPTKDIIISGDKAGNIGLWDATEAFCDYEGLEDNKGRSWYFEAHQRTVSVVKFSPVDAHHLYSSSYDCTVRRLNFETGMSEEIIDCDRWDSMGDNLIHAFDFDPTGNTIWAVDNGGGMIHRDLREPMQTARRWTVDRAKIGGLSINPINPNIAVTGHLKHDVRLWDLRKLLGMPDDDDITPAYGDDFEDCVVAKFAHSKACSSTYWDRSGTKVLTTSYDDRLRVFDVNPKKLGELKHAEDWTPSTKIEHNNQTGAYVSVFRAQWSTCPTQPLHIHVANMGRTLDVYSPVQPRGAPLVQLSDASITAVPAVTASHPTREFRYAGGNASGKVSLYAPQRDDMPA